MLYLPNFHHQSTAPDRLRPTDFAGLTFSKEDVLWALGFVKTTGEPSGANEQNPLVVRPIKVGTQDGIEVKWVQPDRPLKTSEWLHVGLMFELDGLVGGVNATVQGYWTQVLPKARCEETVNPHGKTVPPAGSSTLPGAKGGINEEGFYTDANRHSDGDAYGHLHSDLYGDGDTNGH